MIFITMIFIMIYLFDMDIKVKFIKNNDYC